MKFWAESCSQNTKQVQKITQVQHHLQLPFKFQIGFNTKFVPAYLIGLSPLLASEESFWKTSWIEKKIHSMKIFKKQKNAPKTLLFQQQIKSHFWPGKCWNLVFSIFRKVVENWISFQKNTITKSIGILNRKLEPKYETGAKDNTSSASSSTSFQNSNRDQHQICSSLSKQVYLLP